MFYTSIILFNNRLYFNNLCVCVLSQSFPTLCNPRKWCQPGSSVHRILPARILEWVAIFFSRGSSQPGDQTHISCISCIGRSVLYHEPPGKPPNLIPIFIFKGFQRYIIGEGNGNSLQCSCLENPRGGGAWWAAVYGVAQSRT